MRPFLANFKSYVQTDQSLFLFWRPRQQLLLSGRAFAFAFRQALRPGPLFCPFRLGALVDAFTQACLVFWISLRSLQCRIDLLCDGGLCGKKKRRRAPGADISEEGASV